MHWLYFDEASPLALEKAGFAYDSTWGYNDAVGYRAGTSQAFRLPQTRDLLELPLHIQDTALFYPDRMGLSEDEAFQSCKKLLRNAFHLGGAVTINWHGRSLAPERLWGEFYRRLLREIEKYRVWFATASEAVNWFRQRRSVVFECLEVDKTSGQPLIRVSAPGNISPQAVIRSYKPSSRDAKTGEMPTSPALYSDCFFTGESDLELRS